MHTLRRAFLAAVLVSTVSCDAPPPLPTEAGVPWELAELRRATLSDVAYDVALEIPSSRDQPVRGRTEVSFVWDDAERRPVVLDFVEAAARVHSVTVNGEPAEWRAVEDHVVIESDALERGARARVGLAYDAGDGALNRSDDFLYTLFVPDRARFTLPVFEQPGLRARFALALTVPDGWTAVANAPARATPPRVSLPGRDAAATAAASGTFVFAETPPIPTYLFAFAAGRFQVEEAERGGRTLRMFHRETDSSRVARNREAVFDLHQTALSWMEEYTGIPYPFEKFDFVLIPSFQYGGMEHPGAVFYRQEGVLLEESATQAELLGRASLIAHETAHMWFGDLVTLAWFDDVWTKEVFANFMAAKIVHPSFPEVDHELRFLLAHHPAAYGVDRTAGANPIRQPLANLREAGTLYGPIIYQKAPVVMQQLERRVGSEALREGLREYLRTYAFGNASWPDLVAILDARSPENLAAWSRVWVEEPGRPTVAVVLEAQGAEVARLGLRQEDPEGKGRVWPQRVRMALVHGDSTTVADVDLSGAEVWLDGWAGAAVPDLVIPNAAGVEYARFVLDERTLAALPERIPTLGSALLRGAAWVTLWDAVLDGSVSPERFVDAALAGLATESVEQNVQRILNSLGEAWWRFLTSDARVARAERVEAALWEGATRAAAPTVRAAFFGAYRRMAVSPGAGRRLLRLWSGEERAPVPLAESDQTSLAWALAVREVPGWEDAVERQARRITNPDRRARYDFVRPALSADPAEREQLFEALLDPANRQREPWVLDALSLLAHPLRQEHALRFVTPALAELEEIQQTGDIFFPDRWLDAALGGHSSPAAADLVQAFLDARPDYPARLRAKILQAADGLFRAARITGGSPAAG